MNRDRARPEPDVRDRRLPSGGRSIDRARPVRFTFDGRELSGFAGDTLASALLANGITSVATSVYRRRPRGVMTAGPEEPNALVQVTWPDGTSEPMLRATRVELVDGLAASSRAGKGRLVAAPASRHDRRYAHADVLVVGAGAAGLTAAAAAPGDARLIVLDDGPSIY